jgi:hypothetical protein
VGECKECCWWVLWESAKSAVGGSCGRDVMAEDCGVAIDRLCDGHVQAATKGDDL